jgi:dihydropteroate synthase-like protein
MPQPCVLFVTGRLAEQPLRRIAGELANAAGILPEVAVLGISVAALMHVEFVRRKLRVPRHVDRVVVPGWCQGDLAQLDRHFGKPFERGPKDLHDLPEFFGQKERRPVDLSHYDIEILAEINHAPRLDDAEILRQAEEYRQNGADIIDLGCIPGERWARAADVTRLLRDRGCRVSIDSFDRQEVEDAVAAGAELVLSVNATNRDWAAKLPAELVAIPDDPRDLSTLAPTIETLRKSGARFRIDPIIEPIGFGFAESLGRFLAARQKWPETEIMMGIGNLTELTEVDSAGMNMLLAGFCQELSIRSVLTTQVINWCRSAVREFDLARRLVRHAVRNRALPKHFDSQLVLLRDPQSRELGAAELEQLAAGIKDPNFRIFAERGELHVINRDGHRHGTDPFELFEKLGPIDAAHAFYIGYEMAKAVTALTLGKTYRQDEPLTWGFLTRPEISARHRKDAPGTTADDRTADGEDPPG